MGLPADLKSFMVWCSTVNITNWKSLVGKYYSMLYHGLFGLPEMTWCLIIWIWIRPLLLISSSVGVLFGSNPFITSWSIPLVIHEVFEGD